MAIVLDDLKARAFKSTHSAPMVFSYPRVARAFKSAGSADLSSFGGVGISQCRVYVFADGSRLNRQSIYKQALGVQNKLLILII
jgi:hypothetical protein